MQPCSAYVNSDETLSTEGERAFGCIRNGVLMAGGAMTLGVPYAHHNWWVKNAC